jgi:hypothetical protein
MNWVRINSTLPDSAKVITLARVLECSLNEALGIAVRWLVWLDRHTEDGKSGLLACEVDSLVCNKLGAAAALGAIGWAEVDKQGFLHAVDYDLYNSPTAKAKTLAMARQRKSRSHKKN